MLKLFPSFRRRGEKTPLLEQSKMAVKSRVEYGEDWIPNCSNSVATTQRTAETHVPFVIVRNNEFTYTTTSRRGSNADTKRKEEVTLQHASTKGPILSKPSSQLNLEMKVPKNNASVHTHANICDGARRTFETAITTKTKTNKVHHANTPHKMNTSNTVLTASECERQNNYTRKGKKKCSASAIQSMGLSFQLFPLVTKVAAIIIQSCYRRYQAQIHYSYFYGKHLANNNSIVVHDAANQEQRQWIYYQSANDSPKAHAYYHISSIVETSANTIQSVWRGYHIRSKFGSRKKDQDQLEEQSLYYYYYFHYSDNGATRSQDITVAAITIQRIWRGCNAARNFHLYFVLQSIIRMQTFLRGCLARKHVMAAVGFDRCHHNNALANDNSDDNESFDILEADEVWLDSFDSIVEEEIPTHIQTLSLMSLHPIQEGDDETETHDPGSTITTIDHNFHHSMSSVPDYCYSINVSSSSNNGRPSTPFLFHCPQEAVSSWDIDDKYDDPPITYADDISEASSPFHDLQPRDYTRSVEEDHTTLRLPNHYYTTSKEGDHTTAYLTQLNDGASSMVQPVSPPQISRTTEVTDNITNPFVQAVTMPFHSAHSPSLSPNREERNHNLLVITSNYGQKTRVNGHRRNLSDTVAQHVGIASLANTIRSEEESATKEQHLRGRHLRNSSDSNLYNPRHPKQKQENQMKKNSVMISSLTNTPHVAMASESPTSIFGTTRFSNGNNNGLNYK